MVVISMTPDPTPGVEEHAGLIIQRSGAHPEWHRSSPVGILEPLGCRHICKVAYMPILGVAISPEVVLCQAFSTTPKPFLFHLPVVPPHLSVPQKPLGLPFHLVIWGVFAPYALLVNLSGI